MRPTASYGSQGSLDSQNRYSGRSNMLETIAIFLIVLWLLGLVTSYTMGGLIHILLVIAIVVIVVRFIQRRSL